MNNKSFDHVRIAEGYAKRPWLHKEVMEKVMQDYPIKRGYYNGLDVGCGAGLSAKALKLITQKVTATDISDAMIGVCKKELKSEDILFYCAKAEDTKIPDELYDIVTAAGVINWIEKARFFERMSKVMCSNGLLIVYDFWITDKMLGDEKYTKWYQDDYLKEFPNPKRNEEELNQVDLTDEFIIEKQITYEMLYEFNINEFVDFMMIQSNVNICIEKGVKDISKVRQWMFESLEPIFGIERKNLIFKAYNWYIKKH